MKEYFWAGLIVGFILLLVANLFLFFGGNPEGAFTKINALENRLDRIEVINSSRADNYYYSETTLMNILEVVNKRFEKLESNFESHRHEGIFGKIK